MNGYYPNIYWNYNYQYPYSHSAPNESLIDTLDFCQTTCEHMTTLLKERPDVSTRTLQLRLLRDCADICGLTSKFIARSSYFSKNIAGLCGYICEVCGNECAKYPDPESQNCAQICLNCARECKAFAMK